MFVQVLCVLGRRNLSSIQLCLERSNNGIRHAGIKRLFCSVLNAASHVCISIVHCSIGILGLVTYPLANIVCGITDPTSSIVCSVVNPTSNIICSILRALADIVCGITDPTSSIVCSILHALTDIIRGVANPTTRISDRSNNVIV